MGRMVVVVQGTASSPVPGEGVPHVGMRSPRRIGRALKDARSAAGLTQAEVAQVAGVSREAVSLLENGQRGARVETLNAVLFALGYEIAFLPRAQHQSRGDAGRGDDD